MPPTDPRERADWLGVMALSDPDELARLAAPILAGETFEALRAPELGLYMAQARIDAAGNRFNLAELPVSRCVVRSRHGTAGVGYVSGRRLPMAECIARVDALLQAPHLREAVLARVIRPLADALAQRRAHEHARAQASRVRFFTLTPDTPT
ncbi:MAG: phosphonate C-P lyase system protein PhnG [Burkholderiaceae bacterium]